MSAMGLTLTVLRCPDAVVPEMRSVDGGEFSIGRGPGVDWVLPDPEKVLSKRHCLLGFRAGVWRVADTSTNGTFLNREAEPLGQGAPRPLRDGDRLRFGAYEIEVRVIEAPAARAPHRADPFNDPFAPISAPPSSAMPMMPSSGGVFANPFAESDDAGWSAPVQADHSPAVEDAFRLPRPAPSLLPDDWDLDGPLLPPSAAPPPPVPPPAAVPSVPAPPAALPDTGLRDTGLLDAFLRGAGLTDARPAVPEAMMEALGAAFRAMVAGVREVLIARADIKGEFRIEQTMVRARGNNPLKFSIGDDDAMTALLGLGRRTDMPAAAAVADALRDIKLHELATMAAMQTAVRTMLETLDPAKLRAEAEKGGGLSLLPAQKRARAFDAYEALHARTMQALSDDFDSVFGKAFARAYEQASRDANAKDQP
jgi:type VI secretion system protein ImpI